MIKRLSIFFLSILFLFIHQINTWCLKTQFAETNRINDIDFSRDGSMIITVSSSNLLIVWNASSLERIRTFDFGFKLNSAKFSKDNLLIGVGGVSNTAFLINVGAWTFFRNQTTGFTQILGFDFNQDKKLFVVCGGTKTATQLYRVDPPSSGTSYYYNELSLLRKNMCCRFARNQNMVAIGTDLNAMNLMKYTFNNGNGGTITSGPLSQGTTNQVRSVDWNDISKQAYFGVSVNSGASGVFYIYSSTGSSVTSFTTTRAINTVSVAQDGSYTAIGTDGGRLLIYSTNNFLSAEQTHNISTTTSSITASGFSNDGQYLLVGNSQGLLTLFKRNCAGCPAGTYSNYSQCRSCNIDIKGCYLCSSITNCTICSNGYYLNSTTSPNKCQQCSNSSVTGMAGCNQCTTSTSCNSCIIGYYLASNKCEYCWVAIKGCVSCNASNYCFACGFRHYLDGNTCKQCSNISNCLSCFKNSTVTPSPYCLQCVQGYYENAGSCSKCPQNCTNCYRDTATTQKCTQCDSSFYLSSGSCIQCYLSIGGCLSCNSTSYCLDCIQSMFQDNGNCTSCKSPCLQCSSLTACESCIVGYYLNGTSCVSCKNVTIGCISCKGSGATDCTSCQIGYYLTSGNLCQICTNNCAQCTNTTCIRCKVGYYYNSTITTPACVPCVQGCFSCTNSSICLSCQVGYYHTLNNNSCTLCPVECASCQNSTVCHSCHPKYYYNATNKNCTRCSITNCITCKSSTVCLTCLQGFFIDTSGTLCRQCSVNISNCLSCYNQSYCKSCKIGYYLSKTTTDNDTCTKCVSPCATCESVDCFTCELGYYLDTTSGKKCKPCSKQCSQCVTSTNCSSCNAGYYLDTSDDKCYSCHINIQQGCSLCNSSLCFSCKVEQGYLYNLTDNSCLKCAASITYCQKCVDQTYCQVCEYGFALTDNNTKCQSCLLHIDYCQNCYNISKCQTCIQNYYLDSNNQCQMCKQGCQSCNSTGDCQICLRQYVLQTDFTCKLCEKLIVGCQQCLYNTTIKCINCINGFYLNSNLCNLCSSSINLQGCSLCANDSFCMSCKVGYYLKNNLCEQCKLGQANCQLCDYNSTSDIVICDGCDQGYYLTALNKCQICTDVGCFSCSNSSQCTRCHSGYHLLNGDCEKCQITYPGCRLCNTSQCLQCESGYYLPISTNICTTCNLIGCEICSQINPLSQCLKCNSKYYLTNLSSCELCKSIIPNCLQCTDNSSCQFCDSGYFINNSNKCQLCNIKFQGCSLCTNSQCLQCESGYLLNTTTNKCDICTLYIPGCSFCITQTQCISCQGGYFIQNNTCYRCSTINGCLECRNSSYCLFCDYGYYVNNGTCQPCNITIENCVDCLTQTVCTTCQGNFLLAGGKCSELKGQAYPNYKEVKLITEYISSTQLKHTLMSIGKKIYQMQLNWTKQASLSIIDQQYKQIKLIILSSQFSPSGYGLILYTDNPLGDLTQSNNKNGMPLIDFGSNNAIPKKKRLLFDFNNDFKTKLQMTEVGFNSLFPDIHHSGNYYTKYALSQPQFYKSVLKQQQYNYYIFGNIIIIILLFLYLFKVFCIAPKTDDKGQIIPHILCYKMMGLTIYPVYGEYLNYCQGFMLLDLPWFNLQFSKIMTVDTDVTPTSFKILYQNLNFPSIYLFAFIIFFVLYISSYLLLNKVTNKSQRWQNVKQYLLNLFICGLVISSCLSLQGAYYNRAQLITISSFSYIFGIAIYVAVILQMIYSIYTSLHTQFIPFHKLRIIFKCTILAFAYINPLYIFMSLIFLDISLLVVEYIIKRQKKIRPKIWLANNIIVNLGLCFMMLGAYSLISIYVASLSIIVTIAIQIFIIYKQYQESIEINKIKLHQNQLIKTMEVLQKQQQSSRSKNHQIYFRNKVLEQLSNSNQNQNQNQDQNNITKYTSLKTMNNTNQLFFQQKQQHKNNKLVFDYQESQEQHYNKTNQIQSKSNTNNLKKKREREKQKQKQRNKQYSQKSSEQSPKYQQENPATFIFADFD